MGKELAKKAASAAFESAVMSMLPKLQESIGRIQTDVQSLREDLKDVRIDVRNVDKKVDDLRADMLDRFERAQNVVNELGHRISKLDGRIDGFMEMMSILQGGGRKLKIAKSG